jgi:sulfite exporter TauE/SafE
MLEDMKINVKIKLAALWTAVMFCYTYADILAHMRSDIIEGFLAGEVGGVQITQETLLGSAILMMIPIVMIFLSLTLKAKANRWANIILGVVYIGVDLTTLLTPTEWVYYYIFAIAEAVLLALIVWYAWTWPKQED